VSKNSQRLFVLGIGVKLLTTMIKKLKALQWPKAEAD
jgi:hypothetical protein